MLRVNGVHKRVSLRAGDSLLFRGRVRSTSHTWCGSRSCQDVAANRRSKRCWRQGRGGGTRIDLRGRIGCSDCSGNDGCGSRVGGGRRWAV